MHPLIPPDQVSHENVELRIEVNTLRAEAKLLREQLEDVKADRDQWRQVAQRKLRWWPF
ncbi:hypothetical protein [Limimaricola cinnabarinus]|nr:hypothetical protein [Limimaricola cinnabarinus]